MKTGRVDKRIDHWTALLIDAAINASESHGMASATDELMRLGLSLQVVQRVLIMPAERRFRRRFGGASLVVPQSKCFDPGRRRNRRLAALIEAALIIARVQTVRQGENILKLERVAPELILRVLYKGCHLRRVVWPASSLSFTE